MVDGGDRFWGLIADLLYTQHGGSGYSLTLSELDELSIERMIWLREKLAENREREAEQLSKKS